MKKTAFVNSQGDIKYIINGEDYPDGYVWNNAFTARALPRENSMADDKFMSLFYYDDGWTQRASKPDGQYIWVGRKWVLDLDGIADGLRDKRSALLASSDWTQMPDAPLSDSKKAEWATYRQALRDLPAQLSGIESLDDVQWPLKPEA